MSRHLLLFACLALAYVSAMAQVHVGANQDTLRPGDINCDGIVDKDDITPFVIALETQRAQDDVSTDCDPLRACDTNRDGRLDLSDIDVFVGLVGNVNLVMDIGPVPGLTLARHRSPPVSAIPLGVDVEFRVRTDGVLGDVEHFASLRWEGASPQPDPKLATAYFGSSGLHTVAVWGQVGTGRERLIGRSYFFVVDLQSSTIEFSIAGVSVPNIDITEGATNEQTMHGYFSRESIADLQLPSGSRLSYATSIDRTLNIRVTSTQGGFAPLAELCCDGVPVGLGVSTSYSAHRPGRFLLEVGSPAQRDAILLETYRTRIVLLDSIFRNQYLVGDIVDGVPVTFLGMTEPPGREAEIVWLSSTKYGIAEPTLGKGASFTVVFEDTWGPFGDNGLWQWLGVKANDYRVGQDQKTDCDPCVCDITQADICIDTIKTTLCPANEEGQFTLELMSDDGNVTLVSEKRKGGTYTDTFKIDSLPENRLFKKVHAKWEPPSGPCEDSCEYEFKSLGKYKHTFYNIPDESSPLCTGAQTPFCYTSGDCKTTQCQWKTDGQAKKLWISEVKENGSGKSTQLGSLTIESFCERSANPAHHAPAECKDRAKFRDLPDDIEGCGSCASENKESADDKLVKDKSVARNKKNLDLPCGTKVYIHDPGGSKFAGCKLVTDSGGGLDLKQLDHYAGTGGCNEVPGDNKTLITIAIYKDAKCD